MFKKKKWRLCLERNENTSWVIKQLFHAFMGNSQNHRSLGAVDGSDALLLSA